MLALVNTPEYKYNFDESMNLTLYQFNACVKQVQKKISFDHRMNGIYAGTVDVSKISIASKYPTPSERTKSAACSFIH